jgi:hypothetical protein
VMRQLKLPTNTTDWDQLILRGGLDLVTPISQLKSGRCRDALNVEQSIDGGYTRIGGYERFDGRPKPSNAVFLTLTVNLTGAIAAGNTITGVTSGATGRVTSVTSLGGSSRVIAFTKSTGAFVVGETLNVGGVGQGSVTELGGSDGSISFTAVQTALAADVYRADILAVPGSGPIRGGAKLNGITYAWRNNAGGTALAIYRSSGAGWVLVPLMYELAFNTGTSEYVAGETISKGGTSATVRGVALQSGTWAGGTAAGRLIVDGITGGPFTAGVAAGGGAATLTGAETAITLLPGGRVQIDRGNFGTGTKLYGCDGVNRGFEFDGTTLIPINTGNPVDVPDQVLFHKDHLWFSFDDNVQCSGITTPHNWTAGAGSAAFRFGGTVNLMTRLPGSQQVGVMAVMTLSSTDIIYGNSAGDFNPVPFEESSGARPFGAQRIGGQVLAFGDTGVYSMSVTQNFGNFSPATLTLNIRPFVETRRNLCTGSTIHRTKSQYRVFFSDSYGLYITLANGKLVGMMPVMFAHKVMCSWNGESEDVAEQFFGSDNGMVYQLDQGTSFDGTAIDWFFELVFSPQGNRRVKKRYCGVELEMQGEGYAEFGVTAQLNYSGPERPHVDLPQTEVLDLTPANWDDPAVEWDSIYYWDGRNLAPGEIEVNGTGVNLALRFGGSSAIFAPFTVSSGIVHFKPRGARKSAR